MIALPCFCSLRGRRRAAGGDRRRAGGDARGAAAARRDRHEHRLPDQRRRARAGRWNSASACSTSAPRSARIRSTMTRSIMCCPARARSSPTASTARLAPRHGRLSLQRRRGRHPPDRASSRFNLIIVLSLAVAAAPVPNLGPRLDVGDAREQLALGRGADRSPCAAPRRRSSSAAPARCRAARRQPGWFGSPLRAKREEGVHHRLAHRARDRRRCRSAIRARRAFRRPAECRACAARRAPARPAREIELVDEGRRAGARPRLRLDHLAAPAPPRRGRGVEDLLGRMSGKQPPIFGDHPFGMRCRRAARAPIRSARLSQSSPAILRMVGPEEGARLVARVAEHHRDRVRLRVGVGPERVAGQPLHVEHRPEIDAAAEDRIGRAEPLDQPLGRHAPAARRPSRAAAPP